MDFGFQENCSFNVVCENHNIDVTSKNKQVKSRKHRISFGGFYPEGLMSYLDGYYLSWAYSNLII